ncbi:hypothetical protein [Halovivax cerinus]|uniref:Twin-arginine translocation signal domain-containing protein n=1 Tax=Halovivax cerinus TaxID=1487865 RepID=A0ABD5NLM6_9EURY|nr:hypothetical protein [Halovivax cerinus]
MSNYNEQPDSDEPHASRRRILTAAGAAGGAIAATGVASAGSVADFSDEAAEEAVSSYQSVESVEAALDRDAILEPLADEGLIDEPSIDALGIEQLGPSSSSSDPLVAVDAVAYDGGPTALVHLQKEIDEGVVHVVLKPDIDEFGISFRADGESNATVLSCHFDGCDDDCSCEYRCRIIKSSEMCDGEIGMRPEYYCDCPGW